jgi:hypothetical protein
MKHYKFKVTGTGTFPIDMLRYDRCFPHTAEDVGRIIADPYDLNTLKKKREVEMLMPVEDKTRMPTSPRWESFGWTVSDVVFLK